MSKSRKKKSSKRQVSGQTLGALALVISILALGLSVYQFIASPGAPQVYEVEHGSFIYLDGFSDAEFLTQLSITYNTQVGDRVELEFGCRLYLDASGTTVFSLHFVDNGTWPDTSIYLSTDIRFVTSGYMRHTYEATTAGENYLVIYSYISEDTSSYITDCLLTVTVY